MGARLNSEADKKIDIYALSILLYEVVFRRNAWIDMSPNAIIYNVKSGKRPVLQFEEYLDLSDLEMKARLIASREENKDIVELIQNAWEQDPLKRPSSTQIYKSLFELVGAIPHDETENNPEMNQTLTLINSILVKKEGDAQ